MRSATIGLTRWAPFWVFLGLSVAVFLLSLPFLDRPPDSWEWLNHSASHHVAREGFPTLDDSGRLQSLLLIHPPAWPYLAGASLKVLGEGNWQTRAPGLLVLLGTAIVLFVLQRGLGNSRELALLTAVIYLTNPAALQGALYIGFSEGTLLPFSFVLFAWTFLKISGRSLRVQVRTLGVVVAFSLWAKLTTTLALPLSVGLTMLFPTLSKNRSLRGRSHDEEPVTGGAFAIAVSRSRAILGALLGVPAGVLGLGLGLFFLTWAAYTFLIARVLGFPFGELFAMPFHYLGAEGGHGLLDTLRPEFVLNALTALMRVLLYFGPFLWLAALMAFTSRVLSFRRGEGSDPVDFLYVATLVVSLVYVILPGGTGSFPKYHLAILPFLCCLAVQGLWRGLFGPQSLPWKTFGLVFGVGLIFYGWIIGDYLFLFNHELRRASWTGTGLTPALLGLLARGGLYVLFPAMIGWMLYRRTHDKSHWRAVLLACLLASQIGLTGSQALGRYFVVHAYGSPVHDFVELARMLQRETDPEEWLLALPEVCYQANRRMVPGMSRDFWDQPEALARLVEEQDPAAIVYGLPLHTVRQMKEVFTDPRVVAVLEREYRRVPVGEYTVWLHR